MAEAGWTVAVDAGGTFTDAIAVSPAGQARVAKVPSTPEDPGLAFEQALTALTAHGVVPADVTMIVHGTTVATNALLTGQLARVVLATTAGFRDILGYRNGTRPVVYDLAQPRPRELVPRRNRVEVTERLSASGEAVIPLVPGEISRAVSEISALRPEAVAVAFLFSYLDDRHERAMVRALEEQLPGIPVAASAVVAREFREYPRIATAVVNAGLRPVVGNYLLGMADRAQRLGVTAPLLIMQSNGGCVPAERAAREAHRLVLSGPAAGVTGAAALGARYGLRQLVSLDMGGTSLDVCLVRDQDPPVTPVQILEDNPILCPSVDIVTVGAGGGSIAHVDRAGRLRIGPESAGAVPGPAAYGAGGDRATVTDAHVVAGTLPSGVPLAGGLALDASAARRAVAALADRLGLAVEDTADGIIRVAVSQMTGALRRVSVERGIDPGDYTLVAFGGAGPLHAGLLLREMGFGAVLVPRYPGIFAASGLVSADLRIDESRTVLRVLGPDLPGELAAWYSETARGMIARLRRDGIPRGRIRVAASADCRFVGQGYELTVPVRSWETRRLASLPASFRGLHLRTYGHADTAQLVEVVTLRLTAFGALPCAEAACLPRGTARSARSAVTSRVRGRLPGSATSCELPVYERELLRAGNRVAGPAIVHQLDATTVILDGQRARVDTHGSMWLEAAP